MGAASRTSAAAAGTAARTAGPPAEMGLGSGEIDPSEVQANERRAIALCVAASLVPAIVLGVVLAVAVAPVAGAVALVVVAAAVTYALRWTAPAVALRRVGAVPLSEHDNPRIFNLTEGLCATFGLRMPQLYVVFDAAPNSCVLGRGTDAADLVVTSGLLDAMGPLELEGVVAHELAHVKRGDNAVSSVALSLSRFGGAGTLRRCVGRGREYRADVVAASAIRYPRGLLEALSKMEHDGQPSAPSPSPSGRFQATRWVWIDPSVGHRPGTSHAEPVEGDLDATSVRAAALSLW